jgi:hypothetical protein
METLAKKEWSITESEKFYTSLLQQALATIPESGAVMVLGPMFIINSPEENFILFEQAQTELKEKGLTVFNQLPFVDYNLKDAPFRYDLKFESFYKKLIQSGKIKACYLLPNWEKSEGTKTEVEYCAQAGVSTHVI